jgi:hypothetical protein
MISELTVCSAQTVHLSWIKISTISKQAETSFHLSLVTKEYHPVRSKRFLRLWYIWCKLWICLAPSLTLSPNGPKQDSHGPHLLRLPSDVFKPCTYLDSRLAQSPNEPKRASIWASSPRSTMHCVQNDLWASSTFGANCATIIHQN